MLLRAREREREKPKKIKIKGLFEKCFWKQFSVFKNKNIKKTCLIDCFLDIGFKIKKQLLHSLRISNSMPLFIFCFFYLISTLTSFSLSALVFVFILFFYIISPIAHPPHIPAFHPIKSTHIKQLTTAVTR